MRLLTYGCPADSLNKKLLLEESTAMKFLYRSAIGLIRCLCDEYLRAPIDDETKDLLTQR